MLHSRGLERVLSGHPWIYRSQVREMDSELNPGDSICVFSDRKRFIGIGFFNPKSEIVIRLLTRRDEPINRAFFEKRIAQAVAWRKIHVGAQSALRWINSESDNLPGLIVDEYAGFFVLQVTSLGMDQQKDLLVKILADMFHPKGIYERNDFPTRNLEGLPLTSGCLLGEPPPPLIEIEENRTRLWVDILKGHKTGFYLDQRDNRMTAARLAKNKEVLDCFSYTGAFSVTALVHGAKHVTAVEASEEALALAKENVQLNGVEERWKGELANGFDLLKALSVSDQKFDMVILDPPSFTRRRDTVEKALSGYKEINLRTMKILRESGILVSASCSHHIHEMAFEDMLIDAAQDARRTLRLVHRGTQALDHPIVPAIPETQYLKCFFYEVNAL